ncbi:C1 family peptidase [Salipiger mangrovisoli]|uniref:C1 family peptidase n=1 Tax=Salipiger mangrovisoli TaxID=2865933 RepID=A0ABR9XBB0_9RHOB|nr:C1 family peptidase [Salipiger mangrovisoli]MBE9640661.1 C1 family peptidase [Salipiger mangrovisoli]
MPWANFAACRGGNEMIRRKSTRGGAAPPAWGVEMACDACRAASGPRHERCHEGPHGTSEQRELPAVDLASDLIRSGRWAARDQGARGTCTAFAVVAAEELWRYRNRDAAEASADFLPLSEEYLYSAIWRSSYADVGISRPQGEAERLEAEGATYLAQAVLALQTCGLCRADLVPYEEDRAANFRHPRFADCVEQEAGSRRIATGGLVHNIVDLEEGPTVGLDKIWKHARGDRLTSQVLHEALAAGSPVVAAFATLDQIGHGTWFGPEAQLYGKVIYPSDQYLRGLRPDGGHTVCLTGFLPASIRGVPPSGAFLLRNSFGELDFCWDAGRWGCGPNPAWRGYGMISAADVDRYCWEYLFRAPPGAKAAA